jgi:hypothetical protein
VPDLIDQQVCHGGLSRTSARDRSLPRPVQRSSSQQALRKECPGVCLYPSSPGLQPTFLAARRAGAQPRSGRWRVVGDCDSCTRSQAKRGAREASARVGQRDCRPASVSASAGSALDVVQRFGVVAFTSLQPRTEVTSIQPARLGARGRAD